MTISILRASLALLAELDQAEPQLPPLRGITRWGQLMPASGTGMTSHAVNRVFKRMVSRVPDFDAREATSHVLRASIPADLAAQGYSAAEIMVITEDRKSSIGAHGCGDASPPGRIEPSDKNRHGVAFSAPRTSCLKGWTYV
ncbi:hypothetical protein ACH4E7_31745 [Kitasatospora sp. NPDC018058]|uniref:hypothetical protein n=1 Tax=Kitasatospora sp. NPDC018058 TaxID=3364025 RepID=UPI0037BF539B